jgi:kynurenine formamidase
MRLIDLSHEIADGMVTYKGLPAPLICDHLTFEASRPLYDGGEEFSIARIDMVANTGTYIDVPAHRWRDGDDLAAVALDRVADLPGLCVDATGAGDLSVGPELFAGLEVAGHAVLVRTDWSRNWRTDAYFENHPFLSEAAAVLLRDRGAALVGIDSHNIDDTRVQTRPVHSVLLRAGVPIVEHMTHLAALPPQGFRFTAAPPKVRGMGTFPVRAMARVD